MVRAYVDGSEGSGGGLFVSERAGRVGRRGAAPLDVIDVGGKTAGVVVLPG
jgi:hypothetical protein